MFLVFDVREARAQAGKGKAERFYRSESGATTADFAIVATVVVSLAVAVVTTTRDGASVTTKNAVNELDTQSTTMFGKLAAGQRAVAEEFGGSTQTSGGGGSNQPATGGGADPYDAYNDPAVIGNVIPTSPTVGFDPSENEQDAVEQEAPDQNAEEIATNTDPEDAQTAQEPAENAEADDTDPSSGGDGSADSNGEQKDDIVEEELVEAEPTVIPGCENPYNKKGNIKRKCR